MQFERVRLNGSQDLTAAFVMTKWAATVFTVFGKNKKAPADEQAVRFCVYDGRPVVWATDRTHALLAEAAPHVRTDLPDTEMLVTAPSLKSAVQKARVNQSVVFPLGSMTPFAVDGKPTIYNGKELAGEPLPEMSPSGPVDLGRENFDAILRSLGSLDSPARVGAPRWAMSTSFAATFAAVAKATSDGDAWVLNPPVTETSPLVFRVEEELDGSLWTVVVMPLMPTMVRPPMATSD